MFERGKVVIIIIITAKVTIASRVVKKESKVATTIATISLVTLKCFKRDFVVLA